MSWQRNLLLERPASNKTNLYAQRTGVVNQSHCTTERQTAKGIYSRLQLSLSTQFPHALADRVSLIYKPGGVPQVVKMLFVVGELK